MARQQASTFAVKLRRHREAAGLSQADLAERAGLSVKAIGALERGERQRPYPHTVRLLAEALDLDAESRAVFVAAVPRRNWAQAAQAPDDRPIGRSAATFVGRQAELAVLGHKLACTFAGQGSVVVLTGEAGIGKTYLAREFADNAASQGAVVLWGCCFEGDWQPPYGPWVEALGEYIRAHPDDVSSVLRFSAACIAQLIPEVRAALPALTAPSSLTPDEERARLYDAIIRFLLAIAKKQPVLLVLDDLHWADAESLRLLRHVARFGGQSRVLVVGVYREPELGLTDKHPLTSMLSVLRREIDYEHITVRGFGVGEMSEYLAQASGQPPPQALTRAIVDETNGNPFYAREIVRHLTEEARLLNGGERWTIDLSIGELGIPEGVRQVVSHRVSRLSEQTGMLLKLASGFNAAFTFDVLQTLSGLPEQELLNCMDEALQAGLIQNAGGPPPRYEFAHAIVRRALYEGQNPDRRTRLHRRIALALERTGASGEFGDAELASQYHASAALPGAASGVPYALRAAERARAAYSHGRAAAFLRMARDLATESPPEQRAQVLSRLAIAEAEAVELEHAQDSAEEALAAMSAAGVEPGARAQFLVTLVRALKDGGADSGVCELLLDRGLEFTGGHRDLVWANLTLLRSRLEMIESGLIGGSRWLSHDPEAVAIARAEGDEEDYARTLHPLELRTREETQAVLKLGRSWTRPGAIMRALEVSGRDLLYRHDDFRQAFGVYQELLAVSERFGSIPRQAEALAHIATSQVIMGNFCMAREATRRARELAVPLGVDHFVYVAPIRWAVALSYFLDEDWNTIARECLDFATSAAVRRSPVGVVAAAMAALSAGRAGNANEANSLLDHVASVLKYDAPATSLHGVAVAVSAAAAWELETREHAASLRQMAFALARARVDSGLLGPMELAAARMSALLGDFPEAQECFAQARNKLDARGLDHYRAIADYDQACSLMLAGVTDRRRAVELLDAALRTFHSRGMLGWARRATEKKEALATGAQS